LEDTEGLFQVERELRRFCRRKRTKDQDDCDLFEAWKGESNVFAILECDSEPGEQANIQPQALRSGSCALRAVEYLLNVFCPTQVVYAITSLVFFSKVLVPFILQSKSRVRRMDRVASETELFSGVLLVRTASYALKLALKLGI
jgi:hypothetical protein